MAWANVVADRSGGPGPTWRDTGSGGASGTGLLGSSTPAERVALSRYVPWHGATSSGWVNTQVVKTQRIRVAIVNDYELVVAGVAAMLAPHHERIDVVELDARLPVLSKVDVILYDTFGQVQGDGVDLDDLLGSSGARVAVYTWNLDPALVKRAIEHGVGGYLSKGLSAEEIVTALEAVAAGEQVVPETTDDPSAEVQGAWPGRDLALSVREAEVLGLITQGLSNQEIAERTYLSINSVKTYIRSLYRKIDVTRRSQAVLFGVRHGFEPDRVRIIEQPIGT